MTTLTVGGWTFDGGAIPGVDVLEKLDGWFDGTDLSGEIDQRPQAHGTFASPAWHGGRTVAAVVSRRCSGDAEAGEARRAFAALLAGGRFETLTVTEPDGHETSARVRLASKPLVKWFPYSQRVRAQVEFFAPDPFRYGPTVEQVTGFARDMSGLRFPLFSEGGVLTFGSPGSETGTVWVSNVGTADAWPVFTVAGPVTDDGFELIDVEGGSVLRFAGGVPAGESLVIDAAQGLAALAGGDRRQSLTVRQWWSVPPGETRTVRFRPLGSATSAQVTVALRSTYW